MALRIGNFRFGTSDPKPWTGYFEGRGNWGKDDKVLAASGIRALPCLPRRTEENPPQTAELAFTEQIPLVTRQYRANTFCPGQRMVEKNMKEEEESTLEERRAREQLGEGVEVRVVFRLL